MTSKFLIDSLVVSGQNVNQSAANAFEGALRSGGVGTFSMEDGMYVVPKDYPMFATSIQGGQETPFTLLYQLPVGATPSDYEGKTVEELDAMADANAMQLFPGVLVRQARNHQVDGAGNYIPVAGAPVVRSGGSLVEAFKPEAMASVKRGFDAIAGKVFRVNDVVEVLTPRYNDPKSCRITKVGQFNFVNVG